MEGGARAGKSRHSGCADPAQLKRDWVRLGRKFAKGADQIAVPATARLTGLAVVDVEVITFLHVVGYTGPMHARMTGDVVIVVPVLIRHQLSGYFLLGLHSPVSMRQGSGGPHAPTPGSTHSTGLIQGEGFGAKLAAGADGEPEVIWPGAGQLHAVTAKCLGILRLGLGAFVEQRPACDEGDTGLAEACALQIRHQPFSALEEYWESRTV